MQAAALEALMTEDDLLRKAASAVLEDAVKVVFALTAQPALIEADAHNAGAWLITARCLDDLNAHVADLFGQFHSVLGMSTALALCSDPDDA